MLRAIYHCYKFIYNVYGTFLFLGRFVNVMANGFHLCLSSDSKDFIE